MTVTEATMFAVTVKFPHGTLQGTLTSLATAELHETYIAHSGGIWMCSDLCLQTTLYFSLGSLQS